MKKTATSSEKVKILLKRLQEASHLSAAAALLHWDELVSMPPQAAEARSKVIGHISGLVHQAALGLDSDGLLTELHEALDEGKIKGKNAVIVKDTWKSISRQKKLPESLIKEISEVTSKAQHVWTVARKNNEFKLFQPYLEKLVVLRRREAELVGCEGSLYNALLDHYEPEMTAEVLAEVFGDLKDFLVPFIKKIKKAKPLISPAKTTGHFPIEKQKEFNRMIAAEMGYDFGSGLLAESAHPMSSKIHAHDVRITTRYREEDLFYSIFSTIHEVGHALYEQGQPQEYSGTPLGEAVSLGIHESQSRLWEINLGLSRPFWTYFYPKLQKTFPAPFSKISLDQFYATINQVQPSLIRTEADEVTYHLHIILRFEIEKGLIEGTVEVKDLPKIWRKKVKDYLGIEVPSDREGVLQDVHWAGGLMGYFPTYTLGTLYAAQFYSSMAKQIVDLPKKVAQGNLSVVREWLKAHIHTYGRQYSAEQLAKRISKEKLNSRYLKDHLQTKFSEIYCL